jgi:hypothetical protein
MKRIALALTAILVVVILILVFARGPVEGAWARIVLAAKARQWQALGIHDYKMTVRSASMWHVQTLSLEVRGDRVIDYTTACTPAPLEFGECMVQDLDPDDYTAEGLFARLGEAYRHHQLPWYRIQYDPEYGVPRMIRFDDPHLIDEEFALDVREFNPTR